MTGGTLVSDKNKADRPSTPLIGHAIGLAMGSVGRGFELLSSALRLPGIPVRRTQREAQPGQRPGIEHLRDINIPPDPGLVTIDYTHYSSERIETGQVDDLREFLETPLPDWATSRWINVTGLHPYVVNEFRKQFHFHTLTAEDVLHVPQRPRSEFFEDHVFTVLRMLKLQEAGETQDNGEGGMLEAEQVSLFLFGDTLITFQEESGDVWQPIRDRLQVPHARIRQNRPGYLLYALIDAVVDHCFPVLERYGNILEELELTTLGKPSPDVLHRIHSIKRELSLLRRIVWPMRELVDRLYRDEEGFISEQTRPYLRDVYEHTIQIVEIIESYREMASGLTDLYMSAVSNRMNEVMKVLTIMASVFIPLTFIAGIYGMNFEHMPELGLEWGYPMVWILFVGITVGMLLFFRIKGWIGRD